MKCLISSKAALLLYRIYEYIKLPNAFQ